MAILVDVEPLLQQAAKVDGLAGTFQTDLAQLGSIVTETGNYMQGEAQVSFENKYNEFRQFMTGFIGALETYSKAMKSYAEDTRQVTTAGAKKFDSI